MAAIKCRNRFLRAKIAQYSVGCSAKQIQEQHNNRIGGGGGSGGGGGGGGGAGRGGGDGSKNIKHCVKMFILIMGFSSNFSWRAINSFNACSLNFVCKSYPITGLEGSIRLQFPQFLGSRHKKAVRLSALRA